MQRNWILAASALALVAACNVVSLTGDGMTAFEGPGYSPSAGLTAEPADGEHFVLAATHLELADGADDLFAERADGVQAVLDADPPGLVGYAVRKNFFTRDGYYTMSVWESEEAMYGFVATDAHVAAMSDVDRIGGGRVTHWNVTASELPPQWDPTIARLMKSDEAY